MVGRDQKSCKTGTFQIESLNYLNLGGTFYRFAMASGNSILNGLAKKVG